MPQTLRLTDSPEDLARASRILRGGGLVAFPTETVYGLAADGLNDAAVRRIYEAKRRPSHNPLILHVADEAMAKELAADWPECARRLAARFWPGPLTLVLRARQGLESIALAGDGTIALRCPAHPVALQLLRASQLPLAAPSANPSGSLSPVTAAHVLAGLDGRIDAVVDGGPCSVGIESTVVDLTGPFMVVLRPGGLPRSALEACLGAHVELAPASPAGGGGVLRSPGLLERHYAPDVPLVLARDRDEAAGAGPGDVVLWCGPRGDGARGAVSLEAPADPEGYAAALYGLLWEASSHGASRIVAERPPEGPLWEGVHDRLRRASAPPG